MNDKDKEAFDKWRSKYIKTIIGYNNAIGTGTLMPEVWQAALEYERKRSKILVQELDIARSIFREEGFDGAAEDIEKTLEEYKGQA